MAVPPPVDYRKKVIGEWTNANPGPVVAKYAAQMEFLASKLGLLSPLLDDVQETLFDCHHTYQEVLGEGAPPRLVSCLEAHCRALLFMEGIKGLARFEDLDAMIADRGEDYEEMAQAVIVTAFCQIALDTKQRKWKDKYGLFWMKPRCLVDWCNDILDALKVKRELLILKICTRRKLRELGWCSIVHKFLSKSSPEWKYLYQQQHLLRPPSDGFEEDEDVVARAMQQFFDKNPMAYHRLRRRRDA